MREAIADGSFEDVLGNAAHSVVHLMLELQGIVRTEVIDGNWIRAYSSPFTTRAECRGAILLPQQIIAPGSLGIPSPIPPDPEAVAGVRKKPAMLAYGMQDRALLPEAFIPLFEQSFPGRTVIRLEQAGHFCQEDAPDVLVPLIETFVALGSASDVERGGS